MIGWWQPDIRHGLHAAPFAVVRARCRIAYHVPEAPVAWA